uniref:Uncharacterized protein n=1 Tax=Lepeophtheirus salmonis TaxID=72036 RepID=A0A0K2V874_LEPSM
MELDSLKDLELLIYFIWGYVTIYILKTLNRECCTKFLSSDKDIMIYGFKIFHALIIIFLAALSLIKLH